jgi:hypothetical protein
VILNFPARVAFCGVYGLDDLFSLLSPFVHVVARCRFARALALARSLLEVTLAAMAAESSNADDATASTARTPSPPPPRSNMEPMRAYATALYYFFRAEIGCPPPLDAHEVCRDHRWIGAKTVAKRKLEQAFPPPSLDLVHPQNHNSALNRKLQQSGFPKTKETGRHRRTPAGELLPAHATPEEPPPPPPQPTPEPTLTPAPERNRDPPTPMEEFRPGPAPSSPLRPRKAAVRLGLLRVLHPTPGPPSWPPPPLVVPPPPRTPPPHAPCSENSYHRTQPRRRDAWVDSDWGSRRAWEYTSWGRHTAWQDNSWDRAAPNSNTTDWYTHAVSTDTTPPSPTPPSPPPPPRSFRDEKPGRSKMRRPHAVAAASPAPRTMRVVVACRCAATSTDCVHAAPRSCATWTHNPNPRAQESSSLPQTYHNYFIHRPGEMVACDFCSAVVPSASGDQLPRTGSSRFAMYQFRCKKCTADADATPATKTNDTAVSSDAAPLVDATAATTRGASSAGAADATTPTTPPSARATAADAAANTADAAAAADLAAPSNPTPDPTATCRHGNVPMLCSICKREGLVVQPPKRYTDHQKCQ